MMENETGTNAGQEDNLAGTPAPSLGAMLREAREHLGLSIMDVSGQIKFAPRQIEALEADDFRHLPEEAFLRGFVRSYAKVLNLDAHILLAALPGKKAPVDLSQQPVKEQLPAARPGLRRDLAWLGAALALILIVAGFALWQFTTPSKPVKSSQVESPVVLPPETPVSHVQPVPAPSVVAPVQAPKKPAAAASGQSSVQAASAVAAQPAKKKQAVASDAQSGVPSPVASLRLEFSEEGWAEIKDKDGKTLSSRLHSAGSELRVSGHPPFSVLIGHALSVRLYFRDKEVDLVPHTRRSTEVASLKLE